MLKYFEGPAGSGKTYRLLRAMEHYLTKRPLAEDQRVLGLSFMHGARRRLAENLVKNAIVAGRFECSTIDGFARLIENRWRSLGQPRKLPEDTKHDPFKKTLAIASYYASFDHVRRWIGWSFPIFLIDEFQDCREGHIRFFKAIEPAVLILAAADEFQDLRYRSCNPAMDYLKRSGNRTPLTGNRRTSIPGLLATARLARDRQPMGAPFERGEKGIWFQAVYTESQAAPAAARNLVWHRGSHSAILSPAGPTVAPFFKDTVETLTKKQFVLRRDTNAKGGPFQIRCTDSYSEQFDHELEHLGLDESVNPHRRILLEDILEQEPSPGRRLISRWLKRRGRLQGTTVATVAEVKEQLGYALALETSRKPSPTNGIEAMKITQAKNREFDKVVVLWPVQVGGSLESQRRLLYNAITRARWHACVLIQDPNRRRLKTKLMRDLLGLEYPETST